MSYEKHNDVDRIPVIYKGKPLSPCTKGRAGYIAQKLHKGVFVYDKHLGWYLKLKVEPSNFYVPRDVTLGIDPGTMFTGTSVVSEEGKLSFNVEFENTRKKEDKGFIKDNTNSRSTNRRLKRGRLRHRKIRFDNRTGSKNCFTANYYYQNIKNLVGWLFEKFPISNIEIEDVKYNHYMSTQGAGFSPLEVGKTRLYNYLKTKGKLTLHEANETSLMRIGHFKTKNKALKEFSAHCVDSHALASMQFGYWLPHTESMLYISRRLPKIDDIRRKLVKFQKKQGAELRSLSKLKKLRVKVNSEQGNHGPWNYMYTILERTVSKIIRYHGGSIYHSTQRGYVCGQNKYKTDLGYQYYNLEVIH